MRGGEGRERTEEDGLQSRHAKRRGTKEARMGDAREQELLLLRTCREGADGNGE